MLVPIHVVARSAALAAVALISCGGAESNADARAGVQDEGEATASEAEAIPSIRVAWTFRNLSFERPILLTHAGDGSDRIFVGEQDGRVLVFPNDPSVDRSDVFLDIEEKVRRRHNEEGLLSIAFHPNYETNGRFFVHYSAGESEETRRGVISEFRVSEDDPNRADPASERVILEVPQAWGNHNGSTLAFGPDGFLYISLGDGGAAGDPLNSGQDLSTLLGSILRINVDAEENGKAYAIPDDNPFVGREGARPEIWAYGLRNVWRMSFDRETGELWAGDVGQNAWEEIDLIEKGGNYGWRIMEGTHVFNMASHEKPLIPPVAEYSHREGLSVTGGHVYRGRSIPALRGVYLYGDYVTGRIWGLRHENGERTALKEVLVARDRPVIASFGEDEAGELYITGFERVDGHGGAIYRIESLY